MQVPPLFSVPRLRCYRVGAFCARHCRVVRAKCLLGVEHRLGHFIQSVSLNPYHHGWGGRSVVNYKPHFTGEFTEVREKTHVIAHSLRSQCQG